MSDRVEYWWVSFDAVTQPAEVTFRGGIPVHVRLIGSRDLVSASFIELVERLPAVPKSVLQRSLPAAPTPSPAARESSVAPIWLIGIVLLMLVYWLSGPLFDALK